MSILFSFRFLFKELSQRKSVFEVEPPVLQLRHPPDNEAVDQGADDGTPADPDKIAEAEEDKRQGDTDHTADAVINGFDAIRPQPIGFRDLADKQLIHLRRDVGMEHHRNAEAAKDFTDDEKQYPHHIIPRPDLRHDQQDQIEDIAVHNRRDKGEQIRDPKPSDDDREQYQQDRLQSIFCHTEGEKCKAGDRRDDPVQHISRRDDHAQPKVRAFHKADAQRDPDDPDHIGDLCIKPFLFHSSLQRRKKASCV